MPIYRMMLLLAGLWCAVSMVAAQEPSKNLDFEEGAVDQPPPGWLVPTADYTAITTEARPHQGRRCARLSNDKADSPAPFGNLMRSVDA
ncbi:MAG: hypothetical protein ABIG44_11980, partial [Planctomycetota bacterium]